uniref:J domain-containing protein n=1 Tax=Poecilia reticulata TaxID=8081 RepID=A0A3P9P1M4_POERE
MRKDYYKILGVDKNATEEEIKKGYRKRALLHHPGTEKEEKKFKEVGEAFSVLSDSKKKARYDSGQDLEDDAKLLFIAFCLLFFFLPDFDANNIFKCKLVSGCLSASGPGNFFFQFG